MERCIEKASHKNLTQLELLAMSASYNLSDGHARQSLTISQQKIIAGLPDLFAQSMREPFEELERGAQRALLHALGQYSYPQEPGRVLSCYASSVAMVILARAMVDTVSTVALVHPTFDNIPDILRTSKFDLAPVEEEVLHEGDLVANVPPEAGCLFITTPNNPTGRVLTADRLALAAQWCAERDALLALDTSFRGFDVRAHYDHYAVLAESGCRYVVIEDTGKLWPMQELKAGFLVSSPNVRLPLQLAHTEILLGISPFILSLVRSLALSVAAEGWTELHQHIAMNRTAVRKILSETQAVSSPDPDNQVSVERIAVTGWDTRELWSTLREGGVEVLPCCQFYWAEPERGAPYLRIALARDHDSVSVGVERLRDLLLERA
jgi:enduracididine biosynthesis enzyme MppP